MGGVGTQVFKTKRASLHFFTPHILSGLNDFFGMQLLGDLANSSQRRKCAHEGSTILPGELGAQQEPKRLRQRSLLFRTFIIMTKTSMCRSMEGRCKRHLKLLRRCTTGPYLTCWEMWQFQLVHLFPAALSHVFLRDALPWMAILATYT